MSISRRQLLHLTASATALVTVPRVAWGQGYPSRPITMIVPYAAGGPTDVIGRIVAEHMRASLGQPIIIENVTGANGSIGVGRVARAVQLARNAPYRPARRFQAPRALRSRSLVSDSALARQSSRQ